VNYLNQESSLIYAQDLFFAMQKDNLGYIYRGFFSHEIIDSILSLAENNLQDEQSSKVKKRVYSILVECLQNITRHQNNLNKKDTNNYGIFVIRKNNDKYFITSGNIIENKNICHVQKLIERINSLNQKELKDYYKEVLQQGRFSDKGGAGLGLIDMARKSGNNLTYKFEEINNIKSFFYLHTIPSIISELDKISLDAEESLNNIIHIHKKMELENILLIYNGIFNQNNFLNLLSNIEGHMRGSANIRKKVFYIIVEMLQNIVKHGANMGLSENGNPGSFFISEKNNLIHITTGNYIKNEEVAHLKNKIDYVNNLSKDDLNKSFNECLFDSSLKEGTKSGLGIIDIRIKSNHHLPYQFHKINKKFSFFTFQCKISLL